MLSFSLNLTMWGIIKPTQPMVLLTHTAPAVAMEVENYNSPAEPRINAQGACFSIAQGEHINLPADQHNADDPNSNR